MAAIEVVLAVLVVGLGLGLATSGLTRLQQRRRCDVLVADLRAFAAVFRSQVEQGRATPSPGTSEALKSTNWAKGSPFGGEYGWVMPYLAPGATRAGGGEAARGGAICLTAYAPHSPLSLTRRDLLYIDECLDDGNLATGRFRTGFNGWPVYLVRDNR